MNDYSIIINLLKNIKNAIDCGIKVAKHSSSMICVDSVYYFMTWTVSDEGVPTDVKFFDIYGVEVVSPL